MFEVGKIDIRSLTAAFSYRVFSHRYSLAEGCFQTWKACWQILETRISKVNPRPWFETASNDWGLLCFALLCSYFNLKNLNIAEVLRKLINTLTYLYRYIMVTTRPGIWKKNKFFETRKKLGNRCEFIFWQNFF